MGLTSRVGEVQNARGRLQQVGAAGWQVPRDGHDGHTVATLLGTHDAVVLRLRQATVAAQMKRKEKEKVKQQQQRQEKNGETCLKQKTSWDESDIENGFDL